MAGAAPFGRDVFDAGVAGDYNAAESGAIAGLRGETMIENAARPKQRVLVVDDHAVVRQGLSQILSAQPDIRVVAEASNHGETLQMLRTHRCDLLILDVAMPGRSGIDTLKQVKVEHPKLPVLILSMYPEDQYAFRALKAGAGGYLTKMAAVDQVVHAIRQVASGRKDITFAAGGPVGPRVPDAAHDRAGTKAPGDRRGAFAVAQDRVGLSRAAVPEAQPEHDGRTHALRDRARAARRTALIRGGLPTGR